MDKKFREILHAYHLNELLGVLPDGDWDEDCECPDIVITHDSGRTIGLEITEYRPSSKLVAQCVEQDRVIARARSAFAENGGCGLLVRVRWSKDVAVRKADSANLAATLQSLIASSTPAEGRSVVLTRSGGGSIQLPNAIDQIEICRFAPDSSHDWYSVRESLDISVSESDVRRVIDAKNVTVAHYQPVDERWLLISFGHSRFEGAAYPSESALAATYSAAFHRIFVSTPISLRAHELKSAPSSV